MTYLLISHFIAHSFPPSHFFPLFPPHQAMISDGNKSKLLLQKQLLTNRMKAVSVSKEYSTEQKDSSELSPENVPEPPPLGALSPLLKGLHRASQPEDRELGQKEGRKIGDKKEKEGVKEGSAERERRSSTNSLGEDEGDTFLTGIGQTDIHRTYPSVSFLFPSDAEHSFNPEDCSLNSYRHSMGFKDEKKGRGMDKNNWSRNLFNSKSGSSDESNMKEKKKNLNFIFRINSRTLERLVSKRIEDNRRVVKRLGSEVCVRLEAKGRRLQNAPTQKWADVCAVMIQKHLRGHLARIRVLIMRNEGTGSGVCVCS